VAKDNEDLLDMLARVFAFAHRQILQLKHNNERSELARRHRAEISELSKKLA
jgi:hypothetical protein